MNIPRFHVITVIWKYITDTQYDNYENIKENLLLTLLKSRGRTDWAHP